MRRSNVLYLKCLMKKYCQFKGQCQWTNLILWCSIQCSQFILGWETRRESANLLAYQAGHFLNSFHIDFYSLDLSIWCFSRGGVRTHPQAVEGLQDGHGGLHVHRQERGAPSRQQADRARDWLWVYQHGKIFYQIVPPFIFCCFLAPTGAQSVTMSVCAAQYALVL